MSTTSAVVVLSDVQTTTPPTLSYTPDGEAVLKLNIAASEYSKKSGERSFFLHTTMFGGRAEFFYYLIMEYINPRKDGAKQGVGCKLTVFSNRIPKSNPWTGKDGSLNSSVELIVYDIKVNSDLPPEAYTNASRKSKTQSADGAHETAEEKNDIPF